MLQQIQENKQKIWEIDEKKENYVCYVVVEWLDFQKSSIIKKMRIFISEKLLYGVIWESRAR